MNKALLQIAAKMLDLASNEFDNHGCNDYYLEPTEGNMKLVRDMIAKIGDPGDPHREPHIIKQGTNMLFQGSKDRTGMILVNDVELMGYCSKQLLQKSTT